MRSEPSGFTFYFLNVALKIFWSEATIVFFVSHSTQGVLWTLVYFVLSSATKENG